MYKQERGNILVICIVINTTIQCEFLNKVYD